MNKTAIVVYVPVVHQGYLELFNKYPQAEILVVDKQLLAKKFRSIQKDIRALETTQIIKSLKILLPDREVEHLTEPTQLESLTDYKKLILPEDEISQWLERQFLGDKKVQHDSIFLRWSAARLKQEKDVTPDEEVTTEELHQQLMGVAVAEAKLSGDWWRQIGAVLSKDGEMIAAAHNFHVPSDQVQYINGDPRANFKRGQMMEVSSSLHSEEAVIAQAAAEGISLKGADLYVTTFPCPYCARLIAYSGIKRVFYKDGYTILDGVELLHSKGVQLIKVEF